MIKIFLHFIVFLSFLPAFADQPDKKPQAVLPVQEKVYLHFDNNCYFLGDTIWYKAYVVLADDNSPQPLSKILYVELLNEQGYILERQQLVVDEQGQANGQFAICDTTFAGYYEVRAYTKWMLNFGYDHLFSWYSKSWYRLDDIRLGGFDAAWFGATSSTATLETTPVSGKQGSVYEFPSDSGYFPVNVRKLFGSPTGGTLELSFQGMPSAAEVLLMGTRLGVAIFVR